MSGEMPVETLHAFLRYDPETGKLFWRERGVEWFKEGEGRYTAARACTIWNSKYAGTEAFTATGSHGYRVGAIQNRLLLAHRVIWAMVHGEWPAEKIDHRDTDRQNNRISNLRPATQAQNTLNRAANRTGRKTSRFKGVYWQRDISRWTVRFREKYVGTFSSEEDAAQAYNNAASSYDPQFAYLNDVAGG